MISPASDSYQQLISEQLKNQIKETLTKDMEKRIFSQFNETDTLKTVIIGRWEEFYADET
jgi:hypothetical protein